MMPRAPGERAAGLDRAAWFAYAGGATAGYLAYTIGAVAPYGQAYRRPDGRPSSSLDRRRAETRVIA
jgi:hypothetical protein